MARPGTRSVRAFLAYSLVLSIAAFVAQPAVAGPIFLLNFDTDLNGNPIAPNTPVNTAYSPAITTATFSANALVVQTGTGVPSLPNFAAGTPLFTGPVTVNFAQGADFVEVSNVVNSSFTIAAFDTNGNPLGSQVLTTFPQTKLLSFGQSIGSVQITTTSQYGFDNFRFQVSDIPEPASLALFGLAAAGGYFCWRRRKHATTA